MQGLFCKNARSVDWALTGSDMVADGALTVAADVASCDLPVPVQLSETELTAGFRSKGPDSIDQTERR